MPFILGELLAALFSLDAAFFLDLVLGNLVWGFMLLALYHFDTEGRATFTGYAGMVLMLWAILDVLRVASWRDFPILEFGLFNLALVPLLARTRLERFYVPVLVGFFLSGSWLVTA